MVSKETVALLNVFKDPLINILKGAKDEISFIYDNGLADYIDNVRAKFAYTKTFLYRNENIEFDKVFFPVSLRLRHDKARIVSLNDLFKSSRFVTIIGNAGSGKTMLTKHFFLSSIKTQFRIPILIELRNLNDFNGGGIIDYIYQTIFQNRLSPNRNILERLLKSGNFIFILDGYDEIYSNRKNSITSDLDRFIDSYTKNNFIVTSRPGSGIEAFPRFNNYQVQPLSKLEISEFIDLQLKENEDKQLAVKIKNTIDKPENIDYNHFLSNPLLLSMFILTFDSYPELPRSKSKFYWNVFDTLATKHDSFTKKGGYQHERKTNLKHEQLEEILKWLSYIALFEGRFSFDAQYLTSKLNDIKHKLNISVDTQLLIEDLTLAIAIIIIDGIEYKFPHKSLQEYFCATLIQEQEPKIKEKIYTTKLQKQSGNSFGGNENFWGLCNEIDKIYFNKFFLIKELERIESEFSKKEPFELLWHNYNLLNFSESFIKYGNEMRSNGYGWTTHINIHILSFAITPFLPLLKLNSAHVNKDIKIANIIYKYATTEVPVGQHGNVKNYELVYNEVPKEELKEALMGTGHIENFYGILDLIRKKINLLYDEIALEEKNKESLLDLL